MRALLSGPQSGSTVVTAGRIILPRDSWLGLARASYVHAEQVTSTRAQQYDHMSLRTVNALLPLLRDREGNRQTRM